MKIKKYEKWYILIGEGEDEGGEEGGEKGASKITITAEKDDKGRVFYKDPEGNRLLTQDQFSYEVGEARKKANAKNSELIQQLENLRADKSTSEQMKEELEQRINALKSQSQTKEEQLTTEVTQLKKKLDTETKKLAAERDEIQSLWHEERIANEIRGACEENNAVSYEQMYGLIRMNAELVPKLDDDGKPIKGQFEAVATFQDVDEEGNPVTKKLPIKAAVKRMRELPERFGNLFKSDETGGVGLQTFYGKGGSSENGMPPEEVFSDPALYEKWRENNKKLVGG